MKKYLTAKVFALALLMAIVCGFQNELAAQKLDSKFGGVQIGAISYSFRSMPDQSLEAVLNYYLEAGISSAELMGGTVENYLGIPQTKDKEAIKQWRLSVPMSKYKKVGKMFAKKGVKIHILKLGDPNWSDEEIDYAFKACKAIGAKGITMEISESAAKRMAPFAEKHNLYAIFHNHGQPGKPDFSFDKVLAYGPKLMLNLDAGHYFGASGQNPTGIIERLHDRIFSIHIKDKTAKTAVDPDKNRSFGEGDTPVYEVLQLIQKNKWPIYCDIELEYEIPGNSNAVKEVKKCAQYCKKGL